MLFRSMNKMRLPVIHAAVALAAHVVLLVVLLQVFDLHIYAVVWANIFFAFLMCVLNSLSIAKYMRYRQEIRRTFVIPTAASALMGAVCYGCYQGLMLAVKNNAAATLISCGAGVLVYGIAMLLFRGLTEEELRRFPKGHLLVAVSRKLHLM